MCNFLMLKYLILLQKCLKKKKTNFVQILQNSFPVGSSCLFFIAAFAAANLCLAASLAASLSTVDLDW